MIRNLVFDFGDTLIRFPQEQVVAHYLSDPEDIETVRQVVFGPELWVPLDNGAYEEEELARLARERLPERLRDAGEQVALNWYRHLIPIDGMWELVHRMKTEYGMKIYLLSAISGGFERYWKEFPVLREMDGRVYSGSCKLMKPDLAIFRYLCDRFSLDPAECCFIDDIEKNIRSAESLGFTGYLFDGDAGKLESFLTELLKNRNT